MRPPGRLARAVRGGGPEAAREAMSQPPAQQGFRRHNPTEGNHFLHISRFAYGPYRASWCNRRARMTTPCRTAAGRNLSDLSRNLGRRG